MQEDIYQYFVIVCLLFGLTRTTIQMEMLRCLHLNNLTTTTQYWT